jgi:hypothetical protein
MGGRKWEGWKGERKSGSGMMEFGIPRYKRTPTKGPLPPPPFPTLSFPPPALLLGSLRMDFGDIRKLVLSVDDEKLHEQTIEQLIKYMPNKEEMMQLLAYKDKMNDLSDAERFGVVVSKEGFEAD